MFFDKKVDIEQTVCEDFLELIGAEIAYFQDHKKSYHVDKYDLERFKKHNLIICTDDGKYFLNTKESIEKHNIVYSKFETCYVKKENAVYSDLMRDYLPLDATVEINGHYIDKLLVDWSEETNRYELNDEGKQIINQNIHETRKPLSTCKIS